MTVSELIEILSKLDQNARVSTWHSGLDEAVTEVTVSPGYTIYPSNEPTVLIEPAY